MPTTEEQKIEVVNTEPSELSSPVVTSSTSNHPFFADKKKEWALQEQISAMQMQNLKSQQEQIQNLLEFAKKILLKLEDKIYNGAELGNKQAIAECMSFVKGKIQALHTIYNDLFTRNNKEFNTMCVAAISKCQQHESELGAEEITNYIKRQSISNSLLGTLDTIEAAFNLGFMKLRVTKQGNIATMDDSASCTGRCSVM